jgi:hypothetical protein
MAPRACLLLFTLVGLSCGGTPIGVNPDGAQALIEGGADTRDAGPADTIVDHGPGEPEVAACPARTFECVIGYCANDLIQSPQCVDGAWTCPVGSLPTNTCKCVGLMCLPQQPPPPPADAATDSPADRPDAKASDGATDAPNDCRTLGCGSNSYCSPCLSVDQKLSYSCVPNGAAC